MLTGRLIKFLQYNTQEYIDLRTQTRYRDAVVRLHKMAKLLDLIEEACAAGDNVTPDEALMIERARLHLTALGILTET